MKRIVVLSFISCILFRLNSVSATTSYTQASQLLSAASRGDTKTIEYLLSQGVDINYKDRTGMSIVCTAMLNSDMYAVQVLQRYGADASSCSNQIKNRNKVSEPYSNDTGFFSGLSSYQQLTLGILGVGAVALGIAAATDSDLFDSDSSSNSNSSHNSNSGSSGGSSSGISISIGDSPATDPVSSYLETPAIAAGFERMSEKIDDAFVQSRMQNYLFLTGTYNAFARGYLGAKILRYDSKKIIPYNSTSWNDNNHSNNTKAGSSVKTGLITSGDKAGSSEMSSNYSANLDAAEELYYFTYNNTSPVSISINNSDHNKKLDRDVDSASADNNNSMLARMLVSGNTVSYNENNNTWNHENDIVGMNPNGVLELYNVTGSDNIYTNLTNSFLDNLDILAFTLDTTGSFLNSSVEVVDNFSNSNIATWSTKLDSVYSNGTGSQATNFYGNNDGKGIVIMPTGEYSGSTIPLSATLDNAVPLIDNDWENLFASVMAVQLFETTDSALSLENGNPIPVDTSHYSVESDIVDFEDFSNNDSDGVAFSIANSYNYNLKYKNNVSDKYVFHEGYYYEANDTNFGTTYTYDYDNKTLTDGVNTVYVTTDTINSIATSSRICGLAGKGTSEIDPWCFAVPVGYNDVNGPSISSQASTIMAGAFGLVKGAFSYMTDKQVFTLLALTADGNALTTNQLKERYVLPANYAALVNDTNYKDVFSQVYGYGVINLDRATKPNSTVTLNPANRSAVSYNALYNTSFVGSSAFNSRNINMSIPFYDTVSNSDATLSVPRAFVINFNADSYNASSFNTQRLFNQFGFMSSDETVYKNDAMSFSLSFSNENLDTNNISDKIKNMSFNTKLTNGLNFGAGYGHHLSHLALNSDLTNSYNSSARLTKEDLNNPYYSIVSNANMSELGYKGSLFSYYLNAFKGEVINESLNMNSDGSSLLLSSEKLGDVYGAGSVISSSFFNDTLTLGFGTGLIVENDTILGAYGTGLLNTNIGATSVYVDNVIKFNPIDNIELIGRYTLANTKLNSDMGGFITNFSNIKSDSMTFALNYKNSEKSFTGFMISRPLAITNASVDYESSDFEIIDSDNGFDLITNPVYNSIDLAPKNRELRLQVVHQEQINDKTSIALGAMYRINPNNTNEFGNESVLMMKFKHSIGF